MRKLALVVCCLLLSAPLALAKDKLTSEWNCSAPSEMHAIPVADQANHAYSINKGACTAAKSSVDEKEGEGTGFDDVTGDSSHGHGVFVATTASGDKIHYSYKESITSKDGKMESASNTWTIAGGTGKFATAKGSGTCSGKGNADGGVTWDCQGWYTMK
jgi:hypothetical protein